MDLIFSYLANATMRPIPTEIPIIIPIKKDIVSVFLSLVSVSGFFFLSFLASAWIFKPCCWCLIKECWFFAMGT